MSGDRCVAEDLGVLRAGKPNIRSLSPPCGRWILLARDEGLFCYICKCFRAMHFHFRIQLPANKKLVFTQQQNKIINFQFHEILTKTR